MNVLWIGVDFTTHYRSGMTFKTLSNMINTLAGGANNENPKFNTSTRTTGNENSVFYASTRTTGNENNNFYASTKRNKIEINIAENQGKIQSLNNTLEFCSLSKLKSNKSKSACVSVSPSSFVFQILTFFSQ
jgi:hypothetical protein